MKNSRKSGKKAPEKSMKKGENRAHAARWRAGKRKVLNCASDKSIKCAEKEKRPIHAGRPKGGCGTEENENRKKPRAGRPGCDAARRANEMDVKGKCTVSGAAYGAKMFFVRRA